MALSSAAKQQLAIRYVAGVPLAALCEEFDLSETQLARLREGDSEYIALEEAALDTAWEEGLRLLRAQAVDAAKALKKLVHLDPHNVIESTGPNGGPVMRRRVDPRLVREQRRAAEAILSFWLEGKKLEDRAMARLRSLATH